jgi:hypothetical protein
MEEERGREIVIATKDIVKWGVKLRWWGDSREGWAR